MRTLCWYSPDGSGVASNLCFWYVRKCFCYTFFTWLGCVERVILLASSRVSNKYELRSFVYSIFFSLSLLGINGRPCKFHSVSPMGSYFTLLYSIFMRIPIIKFLSDSSWDLLFASNCFPCMIASVEAVKIEIGIKVQELKGARQLA